MAEGERIAIEIEQMLAEMDTTQLHPSLGEISGVKSRLGGVNPVESTKLSSKYTDGSNLELLAAHSLLRMDRASFLHQIASQGFFDTLQSMEIEDLKSLAKIIEMESDSAQLQSEQIESKSLTQTGDFKATESHLISRIRDILDSKIIH